MQLCTRYDGVVCGNKFLSRQVLQRVYKYGGQPFVRDYLSTHYGKDFDRALGAGNGKAVLHATAGR
jgi:hypothetical protein